MSRRPDSRRRYGRWNRLPIARSTCALQLIERGGGAERRDAESIVADESKQLLERARAGDESALAEVLEITGLPLHAELERQIGPNYRGIFDADDIMQVTYLEAFL